MQRAGKSLLKRFHSSAFRKENYWDAMYTRSRQQESESSTLAEDVRKSESKSILGTTVFSLNKKLFPALSSVDTLDPIRIQDYSPCTYQQAATHSSIPKMSKMLFRDFIHDSLYNPHYGYFSKHADILHPVEPIPFHDIRDNYKFMDYIATLYSNEENESPSAQGQVARQIWHTPTELFQPYYGYALAQYILSQYQQDPQGADYLHVYEMGSGNGTLMLNILDYIQQHAPRVYQDMRYSVIEISPLLANKLQVKIQGTTSQHHVHQERIHIINQSIFEWNTLVEQPCFFVAMEVIDNFSHDMVRYDTLTMEPLQGSVLVDKDGDFKEVFESVSDPLIARYVRMQSQYRTKSPAFKSNLLKTLLPFQSDMTRPEYLPTMCMQFFDQLQSYFPRHRLILSDFDALPDTLDGIQAPVVQTRYLGEMIPCTTVLVHPGLFDIFFPTDFNMLQKCYTEICPMAGARSQVQSHAHYLKQYSPCLNATKTKWGENPILSLYQNVKFLLS